MENDAHTGETSPDFNPVDSDERQKSEAATLKICRNNDLSKSEVFKTAIHGDLVMKPDAEKTNENKTTEESTLMKPCKIQMGSCDEKTGEDGKMMENNDKPDGVYLHRPPPGKQRAVNEPEDEGICMEIIYQTVTCFENCVIM